MKILVALMLAMLATAISGQTTRTCRTCSQSLFAGEPYRNNDCFDNVGNTVQITCPTTTLPYCYSSFTVVDGLVTAVTRGCQDAATDSVASTGSAPTNTKCTTTFGSSTETTACQYSCTTDNCNTVSTRDLLSCASNCSHNLGQGYCDYFTGTCVCTAGYTGNDCATTASTTVSYRSCVQCNEEVDADCATRTTGSSCATSANQYCTSSKTTVFDASDNEVRSRVTRGCTDTLNYRDECFFSTPTADSSKFAGYQEYTCVSICATDDCNTATPNGILDGNEVQALYCVQCTGSTDSAGCATQTTRTLCPAASTYCYSRSTYYLSNKTDLRHNMESPEYRFLSIERGCDTTALTTQCTTTALGTTSANKVVCEESCQGDGCNIGWPTRPLCVQCFSATSAGYNECLFNPSFPTQCPLPYQPYCFYNDLGKTDALTGQISHDRNGYIRSMWRGCSHFDIGNVCTVSTIDQTDFTSCNKTCTLDGCNQGMSGAAIKPIQQLFMITIPTLVGIILQQALFN